MLSKKCIEDIKKYTVEYRQEEYEEELRYRFCEIKEDERERQSDKELQQEVREIIKYTRQYSPRIGKGVKYKDVKEYDSDTIMAELGAELEMGSYYHDEYVDFIVNVYIDD